MPELIKAVEDMGWELPRDIQAEAIPLILGGGDVLAAAETGSGKTGAFALPIVQVVHETLRGLAEGKIQQNNTVADWKLSPDDRDAAFAIDESGLVCQARLEKAWAGGRTSVGVQKGKYYYEIAVADEGLCRVGWATSAANLDLGKDKQGFGFGGTGKKANGNAFENYGKAYGKGDVIGCFIDMDNASIHFSVNGTEFPNAYEIPPSLTNRSFFPAVCLKNAQVEFNFGAKPFKFQPNGFNGLMSAPQSDTSTGSAVKATKGRNPLALVLEPSRELAEQTHTAFVQFSKYLNGPAVDCGLLAGGGNNSAQLHQLSEGVDIVTGTLGRLEALINGDQLNLSDIRFFVLDEADHLISEKDSFNSIKKIFGKIPKSSKPLQVLMFSATLHDPLIKDMADIICKFPQWVDLKGKDTVPETVDHAVVIADPVSDKLWQGTGKRIQTDGIHSKDNIDRQNPSANPASLSEATKILKAELLRKIIDTHKMDSALIFVRTKLDADHVERYLLNIDAVPGAQGKAIVEKAYSCVVLHSDRSQTARRANLAKFKNGEARFLICTDVAARGIDIKELPYVINYTLPDKPTQYIHRIGRVGRADAIGLAISIVAKEKEKVWYHQCKDRGQNCNNTKLVEDGGCALWYDEPQYLQDIEKLLGHPVTRLNEHFQMPEDQKGRNYGQKKDGGNDAVTKAHLEFLRPIVAELAELEDKAQLSYWDLKARFTGAMSK
jgi:ATP-dependent RNA helicase DDX1